MSHYLDFVAGLVDRSLADLFKKLSRNTSLVCRLGICASVTASELSLELGVQIHPKS